MSEQRVSGLASRHRPLPGGRSPAPGAGRPRVPRAGPGAAGAPGRVHECTCAPFHVPHGPKLMFDKDKEDGKTASQTKLESLTVRFGTV